MAVETALTESPAVTVELPSPRVIAQAARRPLPKVLALDDLEAPARRLLPRAVFGFISGGSETGTSTRQNRAAFGEWSLRTRALVDIAKRSIATSLFGRTYAAPFGIAPMGGACMVTTDGDLKLACAAAAANIPFMLSGASTVSLERIKAAAPGTWFQLYPPSGRERIAAMIDRVAGAGYDVLTVTVDIPVPSNRENNLRNGFSFPVRFTPRLIADALRHPRWLLRTGLPSMIGEGPHFENFEAARGAAIFRQAQGSTARSAAITWDDLAFIRRSWTGHLVVKGLLSAEDARIAAEAGVDGIVVSNHGGRQLDHATATLRALPEMAAAAQGIRIILDGGVRRGTDVLKALTLGADFVFVGRPFLYAAALAGEAGVRQAIQLLQEEIDRDLALIGCCRPEELTPALLVAAVGSGMPSHAERAWSGAGTQS